MGSLKSYNRKIQKSIYRILDQNLPHYSPNYPLRRSKGKVSFIFIHINKTAGTSISKALGFPNKRHLTAKQVIKIVGKPAWENAYKFTVVRNPWDKVVSHYNYRIKTNQTQMKDKMIDFSDWVKVTYGPDKDKRYYDQPRMFQPHINWLLDDKDEFNLEFVCKFENLVDDFHKVTQDIHYSARLPHLNKTNRVRYRDFYDHETKKIVADWFAKDIDLFKYQF